MPCVLCPMWSTYHHFHHLIQMDAPSLVLNNNHQAVWGGKGADACAVQGFRQLSPFLL